MKALGQRYAQYANRCYRRTGSLWEGRFRSCLTQEESYLLVCQRYIELNPVHARMVERPAGYQWSSYRVNAIGEGSALITAHPLYLALGVDPAGKTGGLSEVVPVWTGVKTDQLDPADDERQFRTGRWTL
jgi:putative transposase